MLEFFFADFFEVQNKFFSILFSVFSFSYEAIQSHQHSLTHIRFPSLTFSLSPTLTLTLAHTQSHFQHKAKVLLCFVGYSYISGLKIQRDPFSQQNIALLFGLFFLDDGKRVLMWKSRQRKTFSGLFFTQKFCFIIAGWTKVFSCLWRLSRTFQSANLLQNFDLIVTKIRSL